MGSMLIAGDLNSKHSASRHEHLAGAGTADQRRPSVDCGSLKDLVENPSIDLKPSPGSVFIFAVGRDVTPAAAFNPDSEVALKSGPENLVENSQLLEYGLDSRMKSFAGRHFRLRINIEHQDA